MAPRNTPGHTAGDAELDVIPMKKISPAVWIGAIAGAVLVLGLVAFALAGATEDQARVEAIRGQAEAPAATAKTPEQLKAERDHLATTQRALEAAEQRQKEQESLAAKRDEVQQSKGAGQPPSAAQHQRNPERAANPESAAKAKSALDSIESEALKGLE